MLEIGITNKYPVKQQVCRILTLLRDTSISGRIYETLLRDTPLFEADIRNTNKAKIDAILRIFGSYAQCKKKSCNYETD